MKNRKNKIHVDISIPIKGLDVKKLKTFIKLNDIKLVKYETREDSVLITIEVEIEKND